jgi:hypothetical protein
MNRSLLVARRPAGSFALLLFLAACSGGGTTSIPRPPPASSAAGSAMTEPQSDAVMRPVPLYTPGVNDLLYVSNQGSNSITVYKHNAGGNAAPLKIIAGSKTLLKNPGHISEDAQGNLYVANSYSSDDFYDYDSNAAVLVFAHGANGNVAPIRRIAGSKTGIQHITALTVDLVTGKLFVSSGHPTYSSDAPYYPSSNILRFAPGVTGNVAPFAIGTDNYNELDNQLANDSTGTYLLEQSYNANYPDQGWQYGIKIVGKQYANGAALSNPYGISVFCADPQGPGPFPCGGSIAGVADDPTTKTYLTNATGSTFGVQGIQRFSETSIQNSFDGQGGPLVPLSTITSPDTIGCGYLALGYLRNIYAVCSSNTIQVFSHDSSGDVPALRTIRGSATKLDQPFGIYEGQ